MVEKPNIPPDSCDHIDRVVELMESLLNGKDPEVNSGYTNIIKEEMEIIRTINIQLRTASKFWYDKSNKKKS